MSYERITPAYYQTFQPDTAYHAGSRGWTKAPWPTWGDNPNLAGKRTLATNGLGAGPIIHELSPAQRRRAAMWKRRHQLQARGMHGLGAVTAISGLGSPDGIGAYYQNAFTQPITPAGGGASTVAQYAPINGDASCAPCAAKAAAGLGALSRQSIQRRRQRRMRAAQHGLGAMEMGGVAELAVASVVGYGIYALFFKKKKH